MLLKEFIYFDEDQAEMSDPDRYEIGHDTSVIKDKDLRKCRLTLKMLNQMRKSGDARERETREEQDFVKKMYASPPPEGQLPA